VRPSPASVLLRPTIKYRFSRSIWLQVKFFISALRSPAFCASIRAGYICGDRAVFAVAIRRAFSSGSYAFPTLFLELQELLFAQAQAQDIAHISKDAQQKTNFLVDGLRSRTLFQALILKFFDHLFIDIDEHPLTEQSLNVSDGVTRENRGLRVAQFVTREVSVPEFANCANPFLTSVLEIVKAFFQFAPTLLLRSGAPPSSMPTSLIPGCAGPQTRTRTTRSFHV